MTFRLMALLVLTPLVGGCPVPQVESRATVTASRLSGSAAELVQYADDIYVKSTAIADGGAPEMENALVALDKAGKINPESYEAAWKAARACAWLADDLDEDEIRRAQFSARGMVYAKAAIKANAKGVEGRYYSGINAGLQATTRTITARFMVPSIRDAWTKAMQIDPTFDHGGPLRALGALYAHAPPWPASIGDPDRGVELLNQAVKIDPDYPLNALLLGDALVADEKYDEAKRQYRRVLDAQPQREDAHFLPKWKKRAEKGLKVAEEKLRPAR